VPLGSVPNGHKKRLPTPLFLLTADNLQGIIKQHPPLGTKLIWRSAQVISQRLRKASVMLADADYLD